MPDAKRVFAATFRPRKPAAATIGRKHVAGIARTRRSGGEKKCGLIPASPHISRDERQMNGCCKKLFGRTP
jgi:hypothetical protein